jgi:tRNA1(Val) A37 N6-methylase TrmN6
VPAVQAFGVEADPALAALAAQGGLPAVCADVQRFFVTRPFDHVIANPPFYAAGAHTPPPEATRARALVGAGLEAWARCAARVLRPGGTLTLIHRPEALPEIVLVLRGRFGAARMAPLWPRAGAPASRLVVTAVKGTRGPMVLAPGLVLHEDDGSWTAPTRAVLEDAQALA